MANDSHLSTNPVVEVLDENQEQNSQEIASNIDVVGEMETSTGFGADAPASDPVTGSIADPGADPRTTSAPLGNLPDTSSHRHQEVATSPLVA